MLRLRVRSIRPLAGCRSGYLSSRAVVCRDLRFYGLAANDASAFGRFPMTARRVGAA